MATGSDEEFIFEKDYLYLLEYLESFHVLPKVRTWLRTRTHRLYVQCPLLSVHNQEADERAMAVFFPLAQKFYAAFEECTISMGSMLTNAQFVDWVQQYPALLEVRTILYAQSLSPDAQFLCAVGRWVFAFRTHIKSCLRA